MDPQQQSWWRSTGRQLLWAGATVVLLAVAIRIGHSYDITLWDWIKLLIVPAVIAGGGIWFNVQQREREQQIANKRAQDEALQAYLDGMSQLLTDKERPLYRASVGDSLSTVARARTLTVLPRLDGSRKGSVVQYLYEHGLIIKGRIVVDVQGADLSRVNLIRFNLRGANLVGANLRGANLSMADLRGADLRGADLSRADLGGANLTQADLTAAGVDGIDLRHAASTRHPLIYRVPRPWMAKAARRAHGTNMADAIMPNGQKYEDWLKDSKSRSEGGENSGSS